MTVDEDSENEFNSWEWSVAAKDISPARRGVLVIETPTDGASGDEDSVDVKRIVEVVNEKFGEVVHVEQRIRGVREDKIFEVRGGSCFVTYSSPSSGPSVVLSRRQCSVLTPVFSLFSLNQVTMEAYEMEVLFSRRAACFDRDWTGSKNIADDGEIDKLLEKIKWHVSDDARDSFEM